MAKKFRPEDLYTRENIGGAKELDEALNQGIPSPLTSSETREEEGITIPYDETIDIVDDDVRRIRTDLMSHIEANFLNHPDGSVQMRHLSSALKSILSSLTPQYGVHQIATRVTYEEDQVGYDKYGGTTTPTIPVLLGRGGIRQVILYWDKQSSLTNLSHYELQVSNDAGITAYSVVQGAQVGVEGETTPAPSESFTHQYIPLNGTEADPEQVTLHYRVRRVTKAPVEGSWSNWLSVTTTGINTVDIFANAVAEAKLAYDSVSNRVIMDNAVTTLKIAELAITEARIALNAVTEAKLADNAVSTRTIVNSAVETLKIAEAAITETRIATGAITETKLANSAVTALKILNGAITEAKIALDAVTTTKIKDDAITTPKVIAGAITTAKIDALAVNADKLAANAVTTAKLDALAVTAEKIAADAVTAAKILAGAVTTAKLDALAVTTDKIAALNVTAGKIASSAITTDKLDALAVTSAKIAAEAIIAEKIAALAITTAKLDALAVTTEKIAALAVTTAKIDALAVNADKIAANAIESSKIATDAIITRTLAVTALHWPEDAEAYWPFDEGIRYPDNAAGTTYVQDAWATTDSWGAVSVTLSTAVSGELRLTQDSTFGYAWKGFAGLTGKIIFIRAKWISGGTAFRLRDNAGNNLIAVDLTDKWQTLMYVFTAEPTQLRLVPSANSTGGIAAIDFIYIGTGAYDTVVTDVKGGIEGTLSGGVAFADGPAGGALQFDGSSGYMTTPNAAAHNYGTDDFAIALAVYINNTPTANETFYIKQTAGSGVIKIRTQADLNLRAFVGNQVTPPSTYLQLYGGAGCLTVQTRHTIVLTRISGVAYLYLDGVLKDSGAATENSDSVGAIFVGATSATSELFDGRVAELRLYRRGLSEAEIKCLAMFVRPGRGMVVADQIVANDALIDKLDADRIIANVATIAQGFFDLVVAENLYFLKSVGSENRVTPQAGDVRAYLGKDPDGDQADGDLVELAIKEHNGEAWEERFKAGMRSGNHVADAFVSGFFKAGESVLSSPGLIWTEVDTGTDFSSLLLYHVRYYNDVFIAQAATGEISVSEDYGESWSTPTRPTGIYPKCIGVAGGTWLLGGIGNIVRSTNSGATWGAPITITAFGTDWIRGFAKGDGTWIAVGDNGKISVSTDDGVTWSGAKANPFGTSTIWDVEHCGGDIFVAVATGGKIARTIDGGNSWGVLITNPATSADALGSVVLGAGSLVVSGQNGVLMHSGDLGVTWSSASVNPFTTETIEETCYGDNVFIAVGTDGALSRSTDGGRTWGASLYGDAGLSKPFTDITGYFLSGAYSPTLGRFVIVGYDYTAGDGFVAYSDWLEAGSGIVEQGENENGYYIRFSNGTQICWNYEEVTDQTCNNAYGSLYQSTRTITYPAVFTAAPALLLGAFQWGASASWAAVAGTPTTTNFTMRIIDNVSRATGTTTRISWSAIGRWKG